MKLERLESQALQMQQTAGQIQACNNTSRRFGLELGEEQALALARFHQDTLRETGRMEFGTSIFPKLIFAFCDSSFIPPSQYLETLEELLACFYHFKNQSAERLSDDELLELMARLYGGSCQGSVPYLYDTLHQGLDAYLRGDGYAFALFSQEDEDET